MVTVRNTGAPLLLDAARGDAGVGLANVERRLAGHFGDASSLSLVHGTDGWTVATIELPILAAADTGAPAVRAVSGHRS